MEVLSEPLSPTSLIFKDLWMLQSFCWPVSESCAAGAHPVSSGCSWAFGSWSCSKAMLWHTKGVGRGSSATSLQPWCCAVLLAGAGGTELLPHVTGGLAYYKSGGLLWFHPHVMYTVLVAFFMLPLGYSQMKVKRKDAEWNLPVIYETQEPQYKDWIIKKYAD